MKERLLLDSHNKCYGMKSTGNTQALYAEEVYSFIWPKLGSEYRFILGGRGESGFERIPLGWDTERKNSSKNGEVKIAILWVGWGGINLKV